MLFLLYILGLTLFLGGLWLTSNLMAYAASANLTITLDALASSASWLTGRQSTAVDNTSNKYLDYILSGYVTTNSGTNVTANTEVRVYVIAMRDDSTWPTNFGATDAGVTAGPTAGTVGSYLKLAAVLSVDAVTQNTPYEFGGVSVASLFGGVCPAKFVVFVTHNTGQNLKTGGNQITAKGEYTTNG